MAAQASGQGAEEGPAPWLEIDLAAAFAEKMELNRQKYPPEKVQGRAVKYTKL